jgi:hypothetical protein
MMEDLVLLLGAPVRQYSVEPSPWTLSERDEEESELFSEQCCGSGMFIPHPHPNFSIPDPGLKRSRIRIKNLSFFKPKKLFLSSRKYDPGCSSRIPDPD